MSVATRHPVQKQTKIEISAFSQTQAQPIRSSVTNFWENPINRNF